MRQEPRETAAMRAFPVVVWGSMRAAFLADGAALPSATLSAALVFAMMDKAFVLADIAGRGWCIPGGRLEAGETAEQAARRECREEIGATLGSLHLLGHYVLSPVAANPSPLSQTGAAWPAAEETRKDVSPASTPHTDRIEPDTRLVPAYLAPVLSLDPLPPNSESRGVRQVHYKDLPAIYYAWDPLLEAMFAYAWAHHNAAL